MSRRTHGQKAADGCIVLFLPLIALFLSLSFLGVVGAFLSLFHR